MTFQPEPKVHTSALRDPRLFLGGGIVLMVLIAALIAVYLSRRGESPAAAKLAPVPPLQPEARLLRGTVSTVGVSSFAVTTGPDTRSISVDTGTRVEALLPAAQGSIAVGDYLTVGGVPNLVNSFAIKLVVDIPAAEAQASSSGPPKSKAGFTGWETYADPKERPEVYGQVELIDTDGIHLNGSLGAITVKLDDKSPLRRLTAGGIELIHGGDHVALSPGSATAPPAVLVFGEQ